MAAQLRATKGPSRRRDQAVEHVSDVLLAHAGLSNDQDREVALLERRHLAIQLPQGRRVSRDVAARELEAAVILAGRGRRGLAREALVHEPEQGTQQRLVLGVVLEVAPDDHPDRPGRRSGQDRHGEAGGAREAPRPQAGGARERSLHEAREAFVLAEVLDQPGHRQHRRIEERLDEPQRPRLR
jgi:hypothetical protein